MAMNKKESSLLLFEQLGEIDEDILNECSDYYPVVRRRRRSLRAVIIAAAALTALFSVLLVGTFAVMLRRSFSGNAAPSDTGEPADEVETQAEELPADFAENWEKLTEEETHERIFGNTPAMLCKRRGESDYRFTALSDAQYDVILEDSPTSLISGNDSSEWQVWVTDGNGMVFTPYLQSSPGNIHFGVLFDYEIEVLPGKRFRRILDALGA